MIVYCNYKVTSLRNEVKKMKVPLLLRMPEALKEWLMEDAKARGMTLTGLILSILSTYREQQKER